MVSLPLELKPEDHHAAISHSHDYRKFENTDVQEVRDAFSLKDRREAIIESICKGAVDPL